MKRIHSHIESIFQNENLNKIALLGAFSMFLATIEYLFPRPIPFMRLGLANLPLLLGLEILSGPSYILLVVLKVLGQALVNGTLASYVFLFSLGGSLASAMVMWLSYRLRPRISFIGISLLGALASNIVQIYLSVEFIFGNAAWRILPLFLGIGLISGLLMGIFAQFFSSVSGWWQIFAGRGAVAGGAGTPGGDTQAAGSLELPKVFGRSEEAEKKKKKFRRRRIDRLGTFLSPSFRFWTGLCMIPAWLFIDQLLYKSVILVLFMLFAYLSGKKVRILYYAIMTASITFFHLLMPVGRVLVVIGPVNITDGAIEAGLMKAVTLCGLILLSLFSVSGNLRLPGRFGGLLARTFYFFEEILDGRGGIKASKLIPSLDNALTEAFPPSRISELVVTEDAVGESGREKGYESGRLLPGLTYLLVLGTILWGAFFLSL